MKKIRMTQDCFEWLVAAPKCSEVSFVRRFFVERVEGDICAFVDHRDKLVAVGDVIKVGAPPKTTQYLFVLCMTLCFPFRCTAPRG